MTERETQTTLAELLASKHSTSRGHGLMIKQAANPSDAVLYAIDVLRGGDPNDRTESLQGLQARIDRLVNVSSDDAQRELASHCVVLDDLFAFYTVEAVRARNSEYRIRYQKVALNCQSAHARTVALIATLSAQQQGRAKLVLHDDGRDDDDQE